MRKSARAIIIDDQNRLLVFEREMQVSFFAKVQHYYSIPGGGIEADETPEQAVVRELYEEMLVRIEIGQLVIHQIDGPSEREQFYFLARIVSGIPEFNHESEEYRRRLLSRKNSYKIAWVRLDDPMLNHYEAYGQVASQIKVWLENRAFPDEAVDMYVKSR